MSVAVGESEDVLLHVLVVDDAEAVRDSLSLFLKSKGWQTDTVSSADEALRVVREGRIDIVITDVRMPGKDGIQLLHEIKAEHADVEVLICTGFSNESLAIEALRAGAFDYFRKPLDGNEIAGALERTRRFKQLREENARLRAVIAKQSDSDLRDVVIGDTGGMQDVLTQVRRVAEIPTAPILLTGESGTGKEVVARLVHRFGHPPDAPFVALNCGGIAESLLESELFGHEKGAFTGAHRSIAGVFEMAKGGTVLLDEISEMSCAAQSRFLRVLEERRLRRLGGTREIDVSDTRVIAATNRDLKAMVKSGEFRQDLYYRIQVACIHVPPLRERRSEIVDLARHFLRRAERVAGRSFRLTDAAEQALLAYDYPGNVRELRNLIDRATIFTVGSEIGPENLVLGMDAVADASNSIFSGSDGDAMPTLEASELNLIRRAVSHYPDNLSAAARALGISPQALYRRVEKFQL